MTRKEYLEKKHKATPISANKGEITSLSEYLNLREQMAAFEQQKIEFTEEDFEAFDHNFLQILDEITIGGFDDDKNDVDECIEMMKSIDWEWIDHTPDYTEFIKTIRELYERAMEASLPRYEASQCGFHLIVDVYNHRVSLTWGHIECEFGDIEE